MDLALNCLTRQAYSRKKLSDKLCKAGFGQTETAECLERLAGWGYLDDRKYGIRQIELLQGKLKSRSYTKSYLLESGVDNGLVDDLLGEVYPLSLEVEIAQQFLEKRHPSHMRSSAPEWIFLVRAGFDEDTIHKCFPDIYPT
jgi:regulatory protein